MQTSTASQGHGTDIFDLRLAYAILRVTTGMNMFMHGAVRIMGGVGGFAAGMVKNFAETPLPVWFVQVFGLTLPFVELTVGALLILGIATRAALVVCGLLMTILVFGTSLRGDWGGVLLQMTYALIFYVLLARRADDAYKLGR